MPSFIIVGYVWQILGSGRQIAPTPPSVSSPKKPILNRVKIPCARIFRKNMPENGFVGQNFKNLSVDLESGSLRYYVLQVSDKMDNFKFLGPNLLKNRSLGLNFKSIGLDSESTPPVYHGYQFSIKWTTLNFSVFIWGN